MFNMKLEEKSYKMCFKALPVKVQRSKNQQGRGGGEHNVSSPRADRVKTFTIDIIIIYKNKFLTFAIWSQPRIYFWDLIVIILIFSIHYSRQ